MNQVLKYSLLLCRKFSFTYCVHIDTSCIIQLSEIIITDGLVVTRSHMNSAEFTSYSRTVQPTASGLFWSKIVMNHFCNLSCACLQTLCCSAIKMWYTTKRAFCHSRPADILSMQKAITGMCRQFTYYLLCNYTVQQFKLHYSQLQAI